MTIWSENIFSCIHKVAKSDGLSIQLCTLNNMTHDFYEILYWGIFIRMHLGYSS